MHPKTTRQLSVGFISLGCAKNLVDSEVMASHLMRAGFKLASAPEKGDLLIVNTCAFIDAAKKEAVEAILDACALKKKKPDMLIVVAGCLPQRYRQELPVLLPEVDAFLGIDRITRVASVVRRLLRGERGFLEIPPSPRAVIDPPAGRILFTGAPYAYIKIADGCDHRCAFCAIPQIRGKYRSRSAAGILREAEELLSRGVRELNLIAQDVTFYGRDINGKAGLPFLLRRLGRLGGKFWIRLLYGHPAGVSDDLMEAMGETRQICRYLDLPIQHCSPKILRLMRRGGGENTLRKLFARIRQTLPGIALRTTCLVGFPGETESDFRRLLNFTAETGFDHLGVFAYSDEENTRAASLKNKVPRRIALKRKTVLMRRQQEVVAGKLTDAVGKTEEVLVERRKPGAKHVWLARSFRQAAEVDSAVYLRDDTGRLAPGMFVTARYVKASGYDLTAETVERI
ncbi:MAG: 30S ribosomal protein S12 methylthiotransferase RimO [Kiritimatiellae bacterium]|nr:30S ribosomal protein S12 methylthiotransferase RimO [Kiritimatiellia bacterium]